MDNLAGLEEDLVTLGEGERGVRRDKILLEATGEVLEGLVREAMSGQWAWEARLRGADRDREVARRRGLHALGVSRGWEMCAWCGDPVGAEDWATGRLCGHQMHTVWFSNELAPVSHDFKAVDCCRGV